MTQWAPRVCDLLDTPLRTKDPRTQKENKQANWSKNKTKQQQQQQQQKTTNKQTKQKPGLKVCFPLSNILLMFNIYKIYMSYPP